MRKEISGRQLQEKKWDCQHFWN